MARLPRLALAGLAHLVVLTSLPGRPLFVDDDDRRAFIAALHDALLQQQAALHAYALLDARVCLLVTPATDEGLSRVVQGLGRRYVAGFNRRHGQHGSLWDGRYRAAVVQPGACTLQAMLCIDQLAAQQAGGSPAEAVWSSAPQHLGLARHALLSASDAYWWLGNTPFDRELAYRRLLSDGLPAARLAAIADAGRKGWPIGDAAFLADLATRTSRPLAPRRKGRPAKTASTA